MCSAADLPLHEITELSREALIANLMRFPGTFKFDFTSEYLQTVTTDQLRHMLMAAYMHAYDSQRIAGEGSCS